MAAGRGLRRELRPRTAISPSTSGPGSCALAQAFASMTVASGPTARCPPRVPACAFGTPDRRRPARECRPGADEPHLLDPVRRERRESSRCAWRCRRREHRRREDPRSHRAPDPRSRRHGEGLRTALPKRPRRCSRESGAVPATSAAEAGGVRVLIVPAVPANDGRIRFEQLVPGEETLQRITERLDESRVIGTRIIIEPPVYRGVHRGGASKPRPGPIQRASAMRPSQRSIATWTRSSAGPTAPAGPSVGRSALARSTPPSRACARQSSSRM